MTPCSNWPLSFPRYFTTILLLFYSCCAAILLLLCCCSAAALQFSAAISPPGQLCNYLAAILQPVHIYLQLSYSYYTAIQQLFLSHSTSVFCGYTAATVAFQCLACALVCLGRLASTFVSLVRVCLPAEHSLACGGIATPPCRPSTHWPRQITSCALMPWSVLAVAI